MGETYFISDLHFGHQNILAYDNRPFATIEEHDRALIDYWNQAVGYDDEVWILGDVSWYSATKTVEILKKLNGIKKLCIGNHDKKLLKNAEFRQQFAEIVNYKELMVGDTGVVLCHYPIPCFNNQYRGWVHLYGHVHNSFEWHMMEHHKRLMEQLYEKPCRMYNVGCMMGGMGWRPITLKHLLELI